jgi:hypothetical protein
MATVAACGPPGGGRQDLPRRFLRQFALLAAPAPGEEAMKAIFAAITGGFLDTGFGAAAADLRARLLKPLVDCAVEVYLRVRLLLLLLLLLVVVLLLLQLVDAAGSGGGDGDGDGGGLSESCHAVEILRSAEM